MGAYKYGNGWRFRFWHAGKLYEKYGFETKKVAEREEHSLRRQLESTGVLAHSSDLTVTGYVGRWLLHVKTAVAPKTLRSYEGMLERHIQPTLGAVKLRELTKAHVRELLVEKRATGLSKNTVRLIRATLSVMLNDAVEEGLVASNPATGLGRRGRKRVDAVGATERTRKVKPLSPDDLTLFLSYAHTHCSQRDYTVFLSMADAGFRPGEVLALQWDDIDPATGVVRVERAVSGREVKLTKTEESRYVDTTTRLLAALRDWREEALRSNAEPLPWVFHTKDGRTVEQERLSKKFRKVCKRAGVKGHRLYDLRHTYATHLLMAGAPLTYVSKQLGHAKPTTTLAWYAHWIPQGNNEWARKLEEWRR